MARVKLIDVFGFDLSLTRTAAVWIPGAWVPGKWKFLRVMTCGGPIEGQSPRRRAERLSEIVEQLRSFVGWPVQSDARVFCEDHAYGLSARSGMATAELHGAVKSGLYPKVVEPINVSTARSLFLGKQPKGVKRQVAVVQALKKAGWPYVGSDEGDALLVANAGRHLIGLPALAIR